MRDRPTGEELLALVERIEGGDGSIILPDDERYKELMIAGARAIAERQRDIGDGPEKRDCGNSPGFWAPKSRSPTSTRPWRRRSGPAIMVRGRRIPPPWAGTCGRRRWKGCAKAAPRSSAPWDWNRA